MAQRYGYPVTSITLHFLGGMTAIEGEARTPAPGVLDRRRRAADLARGRRRGLGAVARDARRAAADGGRGLLAGANLLVGVLNLVPGLPLDGGRVLKAAGLGRHRQPCTAAPSSPAGAAASPPLALLAWPLLQEQVIGEPPELLDFVLVVHRRPVPLDRRDGRDGPRPAPAAAPAPRRPRPRAPYPHRPRRPAARRGRAPGAGGRGRQHRHRHAPTARPVGVVNEAALLAMPGRPPPVGGGLLGRPHPRGGAHACPPTSRART